MKWLYTLGWVVSVAASLAFAPEADCPAPLELKKHCVSDERGYACAVEFVAPQ
tara:strand:- start:247 stop:405 length:159 start_codon:yes stop_codon:yes gene_type:complete